MALWNPSDIHPGLVNVIDITLGHLNEAGVPFKVYSGLRSFAQQNDLYAKGRTKPGRIVTKARGGQSMHNYGLALDLAPLKDPNKPRGNIRFPEDGSEEWLTLEACVMMSAREADELCDDGIDYEWGGRWRGLTDSPHVQVRTTLTELRSGAYPYCNNLDWLVKAHTTFLYGTKWMNRRVQYLLNILGYSAGHVDGIIGVGTKAAMTEFSSVMDLKQDGSISELLVEALVEAAQGHEEPEM